MNRRLQAPGPLLSLALATALGLALGAAALVWTRTEIVSLRYERVELMQREAALREELERLQLEHAALAAPKRIEKYAHRLGLVYPSQDQVLRVDLEARNPQGDAP